MATGFKDKHKKFHPIRKKKVHTQRRQIGIVSGGLAKGSGVVAKSLGKSVLSAIGSGAKGGLKIAGTAIAKDVKNELKGLTGGCQVLSINPRTGQVGGINLSGASVKVDSCTLNALIESGTTNLDTLSGGLFGSNFISLPDDKKAVVLFLQQGNAKRGVIA